MSRWHVLHALFTSAFILGISPAANGACLLTCPYASFPYPQYGCAGGGGFLITSWSVQDLGGGAISVHPLPNGQVPDLVGTMNCDDSSFEATASSTGPCTIVYTLNGVLDSPSQWTGTFKVEYLGGPPCVDCMNQTFSVSGGCSPTEVPKGTSPVSGWITASPNPAHGATSLRFYSTGENATTLEVFDVTGRHLRTLVDQVLLPRGFHETPWSAALEKSTASTVHFARLTAGAHIEITRFVIVR